MLRSSNFRRARLFALLTLMAAIVPMYNCGCEEEPIATVTLRVSLDPDPLNFGKYSLNRTLTKTFAIVNDTQGIDLEITNIAMSEGSDPAFKLAGPTSVKVGPQSRKDISVQFTPTVKKSHTGLIVITPKDKVKFRVRGEGDGGFQEIDTGRIELRIFGEGTDLPIAKLQIKDNLTAIDFGDVPVNTSKNGTAVMQSVGIGPLTISSVEFDAKAKAAGVFAVVSPAGGVVTMDPGTEKDLTISCTPKETTVYSGQVIIKSDDAQNPARSLTLLCVGVTANLIFSPQLLEFGNVNAGQTKTLDVEVSNTGGAAIQVTDLLIENNNPEFTFNSPRGKAFTFAPTGSPDSKATIAVTYSPKDAIPDRDHLVFKTSAGDFRLPLIGGSPPRLVITPEGLLFSVPAGKSGAQEVTITNGGFSDLVITTADFDTKFGTPQFFKVVNSPAGKTIKPGDEVKFSVEFTNNPSVEGELAQLNIGHNDPDNQNPFPFQMGSKDDVADLPPTAKIVAKEGDTIRSALPATVTLDGKGSTDDKGPIASYLWEVIVKPDPGAKPVFSDPTAAETTLTFDRHGVYRVRLTVTDSLGQAGPPAVIRLSVNPAN
ncbi:MAG: hypothetical protein GMKNLPBB_02409 [Myxococcota bacterium]|nr:hypothetical protein [Myxococcota bacterium]